MHARSILLLSLLVASACAPGEDPGGAAPRPRPEEPGRRQEEGPAPEATGTIRGKVDHLFIRLRPAAVYVEAVEGRVFEPPADEPVLDQIDYTFVPRVLPVLAGTSVRLHNGDQVRHNVHDAASPERLDLNLRPREWQSHVFEEPGVVTIQCHYHTQMVAYVVVVETPWFATTGGEGDFEIAGIPPGEYRLTFWHEKLPGETRTVRVEADRTAEVVFTP